MYNIFLIVGLMIINIIIKLAVGWLAYTITMYINAPMWVVMTMVASAVASTYIHYNKS